MVIRSMFSSFKNTRQSSSSENNVMAILDLHLNETASSITETP